MSEQSSKQGPVLKHPTTNDPAAWSAYWGELAQPWRIEPEIDERRQEGLMARLASVPDIKKGIYPFKGIRLSRADVEWLLATHENGCGPVIWCDESQRKRDGLDLRGADLSEVDLSYLPLANLRGGLTWEEWLETPVGQRQLATVDMGKTDLRGAQLEGSNLRWAQLKQANFSEAQLKGAYLSGAQMEGANLYKARLEDAILYKTHLEEASLYGAHLERAELSGAYLDETDLTGTIIADEDQVGPLLVDAQWGNVNLATVKWSQMKMLRDEYNARKQRKSGVAKDQERQIVEYEQAVRANRQLAVVLQGQGLSEDAAHFAYHAQVLQCVVLRRQRKFGQYFFLCFLNLLSGYGYRPSRSVFWYLIVVIGFALAYYIFGHLSLLPPDAFVYSLTSFHGRGFFPGLENKPSLHNPLVMLAAFEAVIGLFIEISFIATFTQRFFAK